MELFGLTIGRTKTLNSVDANRGWYPLIQEADAGNWQRNIEVNQQQVLAFHAVFACMTLIASDIAKLRVKLVAKNDGIWSEVENGAYSPVLRKPNHFQTRIQFWENWILSKLSTGNTYVLKDRDNRNVVKGLYVLDPHRVRPMVSDDGAVWYELRADHLSGVGDETVMVPASEIIHDRFNCLHHPLVGLSPIYACGLAATQGLRIQNNSTSFFANSSRPGGLLVAPGRIDPDDAARLKEYWQENYTGAASGKIAVLGDGMKYEGLSVTPVDAQMVEQLKWTAEVVCSTFHVPTYKIGVGTLPSYNNVQALNVEYYSQCLQSHIEAAEVCLDEGLGTGEKLGTEFDVENLLRMDSVTQMDVLEKSKSVLTLDERRKKIDAPKITGGDTVYLQQQDHSIEAIAARDAQLIEQAKNPPQETPAPVNDNAGEIEAQRALTAMMKGLADV